MVMLNEVIEAKLMPAMSVDETVSAFKEYQSLRKKLAEKGDFVSFGSGKGEKEAPTKQWRVKLSRYFGLCAEITKEWDTKEDDNSITYHKRARVTHIKTGLFYEATGACNTGEKERDGAKKYHNAESHAETRAKNRVVFEFVGFGEVSAEEMTGSEGDSQHNYNSNNNNHSHAPVPNTDHPSEIQMKQIYGEVVCEDCGIRVYGFKCPKCENSIKNEKLHVISLGFLHSHLLTKADIKAPGKMTPAMDPGKLTKSQAIEIYDWWIGSKEKLILGERKRREEGEGKPKADKLKIAQDIVDGKLEVKDEDAPFPDEDIPGSSIDNAHPYRGKAKVT